VTIVAKNYSPGYIVLDDTPSHQKKARPPKPKPKPKPKRSFALSLLEDKLCEQRRASRDDDAGEQRGDRYDQ